MWNCAVHGPRTSTISAASGPRMYKNARSAVRRRPQSPRSPKQKRTQSRYPWCSSIPLNCDHRAKQPFCQVTSEGVCVCVCVCSWVCVCACQCAGRPVGRSDSRSVGRSFRRSPRRLAGRADGRHSINMLLGKRPWERPGQAAISTI